MWQPAREGDSHPALERAVHWWWRVTPVQRKACDLQAIMGLGWLWQHQGKKDKTRSLPAGVYGRLRRVWHEGLAKSGRTLSEEVQV